MMGVCFQVFDCSIGQQDSELLKEIYLFAQCILDFFPQPFLILWVNASPHIVSAWKALQRIKPPDAVTLVRPIQKLPRCVVQNPSTGVAQPLCLCEPGFATAQCVLGALAFCHVDRRGDNLYKLSGCREGG